MTVAQPPADAGPREWRDSAGDKSWRPVEVLRPRGAEAVAAVGCRHRRGRHFPLAETLAPRCLGRADPAATRGELDPGRTSSNEYTARVQRA